MSTEATQSGADVVALEDLFVDPADNLGNGNVEQTNGASGNEGQHQVEIDPETGEPANLEVDDDLELELDPNAGHDPNAAVELVIPDDHKIKLTIDGQEVEYAFSDLKAAAQKAEGANKKFEEAAAIRKEYTEKAQQLPIREQQLGQVLDYYIKASQEFMQAQQPDWAKLLTEDPQKYLQERHNWEIRQNQLNQAAQVRANLQAQQARDAEASAKQRAIEARSELVKAIPEWSDPQKLAAGAQQIDQYLAQSGIPVEMRTAIDSANVLLIARKAMLYDQAIAKQKQARMVGGARGQQSSQQVATQQGQQRRQTGGRVERPGAGNAVQTAASRANLSKANAAKAFNANPSVDTLASFFE